MKFHLERLERKKESRNDDDNRKKTVENDSENSENESENESKNDGGIGLKICIEIMIIAMSDC